MAKKTKSAKDPRKGHFKLSHGVIMSQEYLSLPYAAQSLYVHLCRLRNRLTKGRNANSDFSFWRPEHKLIDDAGMPRMTLRRARKALVDAKLVSYNPNARPAGQYTILDDVYQAEMDKHVDADALKTPPEFRLDGW